MHYDPKKWKVYTWKHWMMLHWIINPGMALNELVLGQRVPKVSLEDKTLDKPRIERSFVPCPHCNTIHDARTWSTQNGTAFKNWFGLYCPNCSNIIPCLTNGLSAVLLAITFPIWGWFRKSLEASWLAKQPARYQNLDLANIPNLYEGTGWVAEGLGFGLFMYIAMTFISPWLSAEPITTKMILVGIPTWTLSGLGYGYMMKVFFGKKGKGVSAN